MEWWAWIVLVLTALVFYWLGHYMGWAQRDKIAEKFHVAANSGERKTHRIQTRNADKDGEASRVLKARYRRRG